MLSNSSFIRDWRERMGENTPLTEASVLQYINARESANGKPGNNWTLGETVWDGLEWATEILDASGALITRTAKSVAENVIKAHNEPEGRPFSSIGTSETVRVAGCVGSPASFEIGRDDDDLPMHVLVRS